MCNSCAEIPSIVCQHHQDGKIINENWGRQKQMTNTSACSPPDAPWCEIRPSHASATLVTTQFPSKKKERWEEGVGVKGRNEPQNIV